MTILTKSRHPRSILAACNISNFTMHLNINIWVPLTVYVKDDQCLSERAYIVLLPVASACLIFLCITFGTFLPGQTFNTGFSISGRSIPEVHEETHFKGNFSSEENQLTPFTIRENELD